ncbi:MAG: hypothetical protein KOO60_14215 [Gemmatimonadales bacterium]|nr:hypothetical protein [Gemmatimonadales bacterium]
MVKILRHLGATALTTTFLLAVGFFVPACNDDPLAPFEPEISNNVDSFSLQATSVLGVTLTRDYAWQNTGVVANVNQATTVTNGSASLKILDTVGEQVYQENLASNGTSGTSDGMTGDWTIRMVLTNFSGTINFSVEKP